MLTQIVITFATLINEKQVFLESDGGGRGGQGEKKYQNAAEVAAGAVRPLILLVPAGHLSSWGGQWRVGALPWVFHSVFIHSRGIHAVFIPVARTVLRRFQGGVGGSGRGMPWAREEPGGRRSGQPRHCPVHRRRP